MSDDAERAATASRRRPRRRAARTTSGSRDLRATYPPKAGENRGARDAHPECDLGTGGRSGPGPPEWGACSFVESVMVLTFPHGLRPRRAGAAFEHEHVTEILGAGHEGFAGSRLRRRDGSVYARSMRRYVKAIAALLLLGVSGPRHSRRAIPSGGRSTARRSTTCRRTSSCSPTPGCAPTGRRPASSSCSSMARRSARSAILDVEAGRERIAHRRTSSTGASRRAYFLDNGDLLLCGPTSGPEPSEARPEAGRFTGVHVGAARAVRRSSRSRSASSCWEGMATSDRVDAHRVEPLRHRLHRRRLADRVVNGISEIWTGDVRYDDGRASLVGRRARVERRPSSPIAVLEVQGFRGRGDRELIFTAYALPGRRGHGRRPRRRGVGARTTRTARSTRRRRASRRTAPAVLVERDLDSTAEPGPARHLAPPARRQTAWIGVSRTSTATAAATTRRTRRVSPDGKTHRVPALDRRDVEGEGRGLLLFDLAASGRAPARPTRLRPPRETLLGPTAPRCRAPRLKVR